ncbi:ATP-binding protein [Streptomyces sp. NPDC055961]|uniref:ATP-binding protein n=1 Tax=Streptomyces sp. NPDC055961 TaxID=3345666 RepID=UPI0035E25CEF
MVVSELVTNAIRYGAPPVYLRLLRDKDRALICEVSDGRETSPHLRRARPDEEGGRGLFLVARLADQWGTRYTREGKTIRAEVPIATDEPDLDLFGDVLGDALGD